MCARKLTLAASAATLALAARAGRRSATDVCNEAENSHRGGYTVNGGPVDPNPPAFLRGSQMRVGNGNGQGPGQRGRALARAAHVRPDRRRPTAAAAAATPVDVV